MTITELKQKNHEVADGKKSPLFTPLSINSNIQISKWVQSEISSSMFMARDKMPGGSCISWGIPFEIEDPVLIKNKPVSVPVDPFKAPWLVFNHTSDTRPMNTNSNGFTSPMQCLGHLGEHAADYIIQYSDNTEVRVPVRRRYNIGCFQHMWGENCSQAVSHFKPKPFPASPDATVLNGAWGYFQCRATAADFPFPWLNWIWAWENPYPDKKIIGLCLEPKNGIILLFGISAGQISSSPIQWQTRQKLMMTLPKGEIFDPSLDENGCLKQIKLDMGQVISAKPQPEYPNTAWSQTDNNSLPIVSSTNVLVEYTAHPEACFHFPEGKIISLKELEPEKNNTPLQPLPCSDQKVTFRAIEKNTGKCIAVKLHIHGEFGEYLAPVDRHREPNISWFQDYSVDWSHNGIHHCTYIPGETTIKLPLGKIYIEVSKGFEIRPVRKTIEITPSTSEIVIELEKVLPWREKGWITADTHVHFLSPSSAMLEGAGEGINVVNLLASQWGELMTNVGDFDGKTTFGAKESGGDGEYLVRVGTENRQHVLGHISLLGYTGNMITPLCSGGPDESALGDPVEVLLTEWAKQCKNQDGLVIIPHFFPGPQCENAAAIVTGNVHGVEMTSWGVLYGGIAAYSLSDWYRYLNNGYLVAAVGGTDKMSALTAVGTVRTYACIDPEEEFTYESWKQAVKKANTFVTYGPLLEFAVENKPPGSWIEIGESGGYMDITWKLASVTIPMSRVELIINGEVCESKEVDSWEDEGHWSINVTKSSWFALLVRGHYKDKPEIIVAHSSPVMIRVQGSQFMAAADAVTILEQIEGSLAYIDTIGTRAETKAYKRMRLVLTTAHRELHNRLHQAGHYHSHTPMDDH